MASSSRRIIDLSHVLDASTPPFPGDPPIEVRVFDAIEPGKEDDGRVHVNASSVRTSLHCGTHMDAPFHFIGSGETIDRVPLERCVGPAVLVRLHGLPAGGVIAPAHLEPREREVREARRVVLDTGWARRWRSPEYFTGHPVLSGEAARWLVERGVWLVGVDTPSVDREPYEAHHALLGAGLVIVENLTRLDELPEGLFELHAAPLRIGGRDGSPVRAFAIV